MLQRLTVSSPGQPCSSCVLRGTAHSCEFPEASSSPTPSGSARAVRPRNRLHAHKRPRPSSQDDERSTTSSSASASFAEIENLRRGLGRLEDLVRSHANTSSAEASECPWSHSTLHTAASLPLPDRLERLEDLLAILPCQSDCETLFDYLLQEADWMVTNISAQWLHPIWCRFVHGGRVTQSESVVLVASLAVAALLLNEGPHIYYSTAAHLGSLHVTLINHVFAHVSTQRENARHNFTGMATLSLSPRYYLNELFVLALILDYLPSAGHRKPEDWPLVRDYTHQLIQLTGLTDESTVLWQGLNDLETEFARRLMWRFVSWDRWVGMYTDQGSSSPIRKAKINVEHPQWFCTSLGAPFRAAPPGNRLVNGEEQRPVAFRAPTKSVPRVFRLKQQSEMDEIPILGKLFTSLSAHVEAVSDHIVAIKAWRGQEEKGKASSVDHRREALLHQGIVICNDIKRWKHSIQKDCAEPDFLDGSDYFACRRASQAAVIHVGCRQILNALLGAWVTEESITDVSSPVLTQLQREAFSNARESVRSIDVMRVLLSCGKVVQMPWAAMAFFNAATTLAIPLLSASRLRGEIPSYAKDDSAPIARINCLPDFSSPGTSLGQVRAATGSGRTPDTPSFYPSSGSSETASSTPRYATSTATTIASVTSLPPVLNMDEMRTLAPDILRILDILPLCKANPLSDEARQRLAMLVDMYGVGHSHSSQHEQQPTPRVSEPFIQPNAASETADAPSRMGDYWTALPEGGLSQPVQRNSNGRLSPDFGSVGIWRDSRGFTVLDSLVALDDTWWEHLLSSGTDAGVS
ncbi:hypothetical protein FA10DRAFT_269232 [Acaromyces ingoldii]|uniref:Transcription factor domain-containing protein n=1 Tax=Acaromyces ingoldii TaxID=215250 RepID=A0A316YFS5_9BASI|nr:hypothetical protein FA10DRAFT_269232 [Acaromyces ingoldii]PWN87981.1 hypothetical protein FA10DRAFT_269232 [Acaromyces ingoldii]